MENNIRLIVWSIMLCLPFLLRAQTQGEASSSEAIRNQIIALGLRHHPVLKEMALRQQQSLVMKKTRINLPNPDVLVDVFNRKSLIKEGFQNNYVVSVLESFDFPTSYRARGKMLQTSYELAQTNSLVAQRRIAKQIDMLYTEYLFIRARKQLFYQYHILLENLLQVMTQAYNLGATTDLVRSGLQMKQQEIYNFYQSSVIEEEKSKESLRIFLKDTSALLGQLLQSPDSLVVRDMPVLHLLEENPSAYLLTQASQKVQLRGEEKNYLKHQQMFPKISLGLKYDPTLILQPLMGFTVGMSVPLFFWTPKAALQSAHLDYMAEREKQKQTELQVSLLNQRLRASYRNAVRELQYYKEHMQPVIANTETKIKTAYIAGSVTMIEYFFTLTQMMDMRLRYYEILRRYNDIVSEILYGGGITE